MNFKSGKLKKPADSSFHQQQMSSLRVPLSVYGAALAMAVIGSILLGAGVKLRHSAQHVFEKEVVYDNGESDYFCSISTRNAGQRCMVEFEFEEDVKGPLYVYYKISNFYQNHRRYFESRSIFQLQGKDYEESDVELDCDPLLKNGSLLLSPCGLIANSFFNDIISVNKTSVASDSGEIALDETDIAISYDVDTLYKQPDGFVFAEVSSANSSCPLESCTGTYFDTKTSKFFKYFYPKQESVQYLYQTFPEVISPIEGVTNEHFIVWMRTAGLPNFRKLYGRIHNNFRKGDTLRFDVVANFEVASFNGKKSIILSTMNDNSGKNEVQGNVYVVTGVMCFLLSVFMIVREYLLSYHLKFN